MSNRQVPQAQEPPRRVLSCWYLALQKLPRLNPLNDSEHWASPARANDCRGGLRCACGFATFGIAIQQPQCVKGPRSPYNLSYCVSGVAFDSVILATHYYLSPYILGGGRHLPAAATTSS